MVYEVYPSYIAKRLTHIANRLGYNIYYAKNISMNRITGCLAESETLYMS